MYIGIEDEKNILSYVDFTISRNVVSLFLELSIDMLTNGNTFPLPSSARAFKWRYNYLTGLDKYSNQIDTIGYGEYTVTNNMFLK